MQNQKHKQLFALLGKANLMDYRKDLIRSLTQGRTDSTKGLTATEMNLVIDYLKEQVEDSPESDFTKGEAMRKRIMSLCHLYSWTLLDTKTRSVRVDLERLNAWMQKYSYLHKGINQYKYIELPKLVTQFEQFIMKQLNFN